MKTWLFWSPFIIFAVLCVINEIHKSPEQRESEHIERSNQLLNSSVSEIYENCVQAGIEHAENSSDLDLDLVYSECNSQRKHEAEKMHNLLFGK